MASFLGQQKKKLKEKQRGRGKEFNLFSKEVIIYPMICL
jgi:hypothetical protein